MSNKNKSKLSLNVETIISLSALDRVVGGAVMIQQSRLCPPDPNQQGVEGRAKLGEAVRATAQCIGSCFCPPTSGNNF